MAKLPVKNVVKKAAQVKKSTKFDGDGPEMKKFKAAQLGGYAANKK